MIELRTVNLTRYITPLREGGSLPALAEADDEFKYVVKFRGAGHGTKALISELIGGEVAHILGFRVPELVFLNLDEAFGRTEGDEEIQDLLQGSRGLNLGLHFLSGALTFDPVATKVDPELASRIVWLDAYLTNIDRTFRNTNMLMWHKELWLIDHGASLYFHHSWENWEKHAVSPFTYIKNHVLLPEASRLEEADTLLRPMLTDEKIQQVVALIPDDWLHWEDTHETPEEIRDIYTRFLTERLAHSEIFIKEAQNARKALICQVNEGKLKLYVSEVDRELVFAHLDVFNKICSGAKDGGPIAQLDVPERFRWLTAVRSSCIQTSRPHAGFSDDLDRTLERLFKELVL